MITLQSLARPASPTTQMRLSAKCSNRIFWNLAPQAFEVPLWMPYVQIAARPWAISKGSARQHGLKPRYTTGVVEYMKRIGSGRQWLAVVSSGLLAVWKNLHFSAHYVCRSIPAARAIESPMQAHDPNRPVFIPKGAATVSILG